MDQYTHWLSSSRVCWWRERQRWGALPSGACSQGDIRSGSKLKVPSPAAVSVFFSNLVESGPDRLWLNRCIDAQQPSHVCLNGVLAVNASEPCSVTLTRCGALPPARPENVCGDHRSHSVGTRRPQVDFEQIENAENMVGKAEGRRIVALR